METYEAYTDGSYQDSIKAGGWASIILKDNKIFKKLYQGLKYTTNNRCELIGVIETLQYFENPVNIIIYSDSQYVVNSINGGYVFKWIKESDISKKNFDLWFKLVDLLDYHNVTMKWVKGHESNKYNNLADLYCTHSATCLNIPEDENYKLSIQKIR